jgi:hypothetical protein
MCLGVVHRSLPDTSQRREWSLIVRRVQVVWNHVRSLDRRRLNAL